MNDNIDKNLNMENLEDSELEQVSGGRKNPTKRPQKREPACRSDISELFRMLNEMTLTSLRASCAPRA